MSDKAKEFLDKRGWLSNSTGEYDYETMAKILQSYADQENKAYLKNVLEEVELKWNSFQKQAYDNIQHQQHNSGKDPSYFYQNGWNDVLNHLKQRKG